MPSLITESLASRINRFGSDDIFRRRWSPRAMTGEPVTEADLMALFEAAHWAPSCYNNQPWRFLYVRQDHPDWEKYLALLAEANREWCRKAAVLVLIVSKTTFDHNGQPDRTHAFDTGAAWGMLALEGTRRGLVVHGMAGFDYDAARIVFGAPDGFDILAMAAIGIYGQIEQLPEWARQREKPSLRKDLSNLAAEAVFTDKLK